MVVRVTCRTSVLALVAACMLIAGCGSDRSPEAYCRAFYSKAAPIRQSYIDQNRKADQDVLGSIVKLLSAPGDLASIFDGMVDHAPDDIKSDTVEVRDSFKKVQDAMGDAFSNPLAALGKGEMGSLTANGAFERVDAYLSAHCPPDSELAQQYIREAAD